MYDTFKDEIWKELGPLDPNWFEVLTAQMSADEGSASDQEDLCANQEGNFKATLDKTDVDSQLFSTPKVFRYGRIVSPQTEDEHSFTEQGIIGWFVILFYAKCKIHSTLHHTFFSYAKHISESLGAQINPDFSWTSSLNTPPFVRKLFPSLSNPSKASVIPPWRSEIPPVLQGNGVKSARSVDSLSQSAGVWRQKMPDAIEDGEIRSAVSSVLDGAENTLSIFFANSSSALRKVRPKPIFPTKERCPSSVDVPATNSPASSKDGPADQKSPSVAASDPRLSQWSPLSLSELPASQSDSDAPHIVAKIPASDKKINLFFVFRFPVAGRHSAPGELGCSSSEKPDVQQQGSVTQVKDLDMSQLCKEFAQDFGQTLDSDKTSKVTEETKSHFSPSACLLAVKQAKQKTVRENLHTDFNEARNRKPASLTNEMYSINEGLTADSGFQSAVADVSRDPTSSVVPVCSGNTGQLTSKDGVHWKKKEDEGVHIDAAAGPKLCSGLRTQLEERQAEDPRRKSLNTAQPSLHTSGFKTASNKGIHISSANLERAKLLLEEAESGKTFNSHSTKSDSAVNQQMSRSNKSGFIVSNSHQSPSLGGLEDAGCHLTESQKADVTELCTLLEEAESQFEFTQFKTAEMKQNSQGPVTSPPKTEKELDADLLAGIDFDDSFPSDADRQPASAGTPDRVTSGTNKTKCGASDSPGESESVSDELKKVHPCDEGGPSSSVHVSEGRTCVISTKPLNLHRAGNTETSRNPSALGVSFKSAGGNILTVSKAGLSRARALFADLEKLTDLKSSIDSSSIDGLIKADGFHTASGKKVTVSSDSLRRAEYLLKEHSAPEDTYEERSHRNPGQRSSSGLKTPGGKGVAISSTALKKAKALMRGSHDALLKAKALFSDISLSVDVPPNSDTKTSDGKQAYMENINKTYPDLKAPVDENVQGSQFSLLKAKVDDSVSAKAMQEAGGFVKDSMDRSDRIPLKPEKNEQKAETLPRQNGGFQTASGTTLTVSSEALSKARTLLSECEEVGSEISASPPHFKVSLPGPSSRSRGFQAASGKRVSVSSESLQRARALFSDIQAVSDTRTSDKKEKSDMDGSTIEKNLSKAHCPNGTSLTL
uniref:BRCA2 DNA repair associated n=1 Tax=Salarias fasciatus TaxID=181472 RepID=A0A672JE43_SALFA